MRPLLYNCCPDPCSVHKGAVCLVVAHIYWCCRSCRTRVDSFREAAPRERLTNGQGFTAARGHCTHKRWTLPAWPKRRSTSSPWQQPARASARKWRRPDPPLPISMQRNPSHDRGWAAAPTSDGTEYKALFATAWARRSARRPWTMVVCKHLPFHPVPASRMRVALSEGGEERVNLSTWLFPANSAWYAGGECQKQSTGVYIATSVFGKKK